MISIPSHKIWTTYIDCVQSICCWSFIWWSSVDYNLYGKPGYDCLDSLFIAHERQYFFHILHHTFCKVDLPARACWVSGGLVGLQCLYMVFWEQTADWHRTLPVQEHCYLSTSHWPWHTAQLGHSILNGKYNIVKRLNTFCQRRCIFVDLRVTFR